MSMFGRREHEMPGLNTSSLPDLIFTVLFFFMIVTHMRQVTLKVDYRAPQGKQLTRLTKKSAVSYIYIGKPVQSLSGKLDAETDSSGVCVQLNDKLATPADGLCVGGEATYVGRRPASDDRFHPCRPSSAHGCGDGCQASFTSGKGATSKLFCRRKG